MENRSSCALQDRLRHRDKGYHAGQPGLQDALSPDIVTQDKKNATITTYTAWKGNGKKVEGKCLQRLGGGGSRTTSRGRSHGTTSTGTTRTSVTTGRTMRARTPAKRNIGTAWAFTQNRELAVKVLVVEASCQDRLLVRLLVIPFSCPSEPHERRKVAVGGPGRCWWRLSLV